MANKKRNVYKPKPMTEGKRNLIQGLMQEYEIQSAEDIQDALKDLLSGTIQGMLETEMNEHHCSTVVSGLLWQMISMNRPKSVFY